MFLRTRSLISSLFSNSYTETARFTARVNTIYTLAISHDGQFLASGGSDGVNLWDLYTRKELGYSGTNQDVCGTVTCTTWMKPSRNKATEILCYGTGSGYLIFAQLNTIDKSLQEVCARRLGAGYEITCLAWDASWSEGGARVAVGMRDNVIQILLFNTHSQLQSVFAGRLDSTVPKSIAFLDHDEVCIFGLFDGNVANYSIQMKVVDGTILGEHRCNSVIGHAAINIRKRLVVIDNVSNGFTLYRLDHANPVRTYLTEPPTVPIPKQVAFAEDSRLVVGGSDHGHVYIFDRKSGELLETLHHSSTGLAQSLAVRDADGRCIIASASPATGRKQVNIKVWAHIYNPHAKPSTPNTLSSSKSIWTTIKLLILLALLSFGVQSSFVHSNEIVHLVMNIVPIARWCSLVQERALVDVNHALPSDVKKTGLKSEMPTRNKYESDIEEQNTRSLEELAQQIMHLGWVANPRIFETTETDADSTSNNVIYL